MSAARRRPWLEGTEAAVTVLTPTSEPSSSAPAKPDRRPLIGLGLGAVFVTVIATLVALLGAAGDGPATGAAQLVPANALLYIHLSTDGSRPGCRASCRARHSAA